MPVYILCLLGTHGNEFEFSKVAAESLLPFFKSFFASANFSFFWPKHSWTIANNYRFDKYLADTNRVFSLTRTSYTAVDTGSSESSISEEKLSESLLFLSSKIIHDSATLAQTLDQLHAHIVEIPELIACRQQTHAGLPGFYKTPLTPKYIEYANSIVNYIKNLHSANPLTKIYVIDLHSGVGEPGRISVAQCFNEPFHSSRLLRREGTLLEYLFLMLKPILSPAISFASIEVGTCGNDLACFNLFHELLYRRGYSYHFESPVPTSLWIRQLDKFIAQDFEDNCLEILF